MRVTAGGGSKVTYQGQVTAAEPFPSLPVPFKLEPYDILEASNPQVIHYGLTVNGVGRDGFVFDLPVIGQARIEVSAPVGAQVHVGPDKEPMGALVNLRN